MGIIRKQAVSGTIYTYSGAILGFVTVALLFPRFLSTEQIGLLNILISYSLIFSLFASLGFNAVTSRLFPYFRNPENQHNGFLFVALSVTALGILFTMVGIWLYWKIGMPAKEFVSPLFYQYYWFLIPLVVFTTLFQLFDHYNKVLYNATRGIFLKELFTRILVLLFILAFYFSLVSYHQFVGLYIVAYSVPAAIIFFLLLKEKEVSFRPQLYFIDKALRKNIIEVSLFGILIGATGMITINIDRIMIESLMGAEGLSSVGVYSTAFFFGTIIVLPSRALNKISSAIVADAFRDKDLNTIQKIFQKTAITQYIVGALLFVGIWVNIDNVFVILSDKFIDGKYVIFFIGLSYVSDMLAGAGSNILSLSKHYKMQTVFMFVMAVLIIVTNLIFIPTYGIVGAAFASFLSKLSVNFFRFIFLYKKYTLQPYTFKFFVVTIIAGFAFIVGYYVPVSGNIVVDIAFKSVPTGLVFFVLILITKCSEDINEFTFAVARRLRIIK